MAQLAQSKVKLFPYWQSSVVLIVGGFAVIPAALCLRFGLQLSESAEAIERGEYLVIAGGCISCHRGEDEAESFVGGLALVSDFGTFYAPNITPDHGERDWQLGSAGFSACAFQHGRTPGG